MKLVSGQRLDLYSSGTAAEGERLRVIRRVAEVLAFAHSRRVIHRDLKPQNIMIGEFGEVYVMDWGIAAVAGTPAFRAPEPQLDWRSDIYSLGSLMQFVLPSPAPALRAIAQKAMRADPNMRYSSIKGMIVGLLCGWFARKVQSTKWGIVVGAALGLLFAFLVAAMPSPNGKHYYLEIMLPVSSWVQSSDF
jgi:hypothetical protein